MGWYLEWWCFKNNKLVVFTRCVKFWRTYTDVAVEAEKVVDHSLDVVQIDVEGPATDSTRNVVL